MLESLLEFLIQGLVLGGLYALFAVGLSLIFGVLDVINVAHGEFFAIGGYLAFAAVVLLHLPGALGVLGAAVGTVLLGLCVYPLLNAPLKRRHGGDGRLDASLNLLIGPQQTCLGRVHNLANRERARCHCFFRIIRPLNVRHRKLADVDGIVRVCDGVGPEPINVIRNLDHESHHPLDLSGVVQSLS